ncbi:hypothetical protein P9112_011849 [Eukaryota sp. TZLM1-RC]
MSSRLNLLIVSDFFLPSIGGVEHHIHHICSALSSHHNIVVVTLECDSAEKIDQQLPYDVIRFPFKTLLGVSCPFINPLWKSIKTTCLRYNIDLIHCHQCFSTLSLTSLLYARCNFIPVVFTHHSLIGFESASSLLARIFFPLFFTPNTHIVAVSNAALNNITSIYPTNNVSIVSNGVDSSIFYPRKPDFQGFDLVITSALRMSRRKGTKLLVNVINHVSSKFSNISILFNVVGSGPKFLETKNSISLRSHKHRIVFHGFLSQKELSVIFSNSHFFLNTSLTEAFGSTLVEACACGTKLVCSNVGGIPELFDQAFIGKSVFICDPNVQSFLIGIESCLESYSLNLAMNSATTLSEYVSSRYSWTKVCCKLQMIYRRAVYNKSIIEENSKIKLGITLFIIILIYFINNIFF